MSIGKSLSGIEYLLAGYRIILQPGLRRFVVIPIAINFFFFMALFLLLKHFVVMFDAWFLGYLPAWLQWLSGVVWLLFFISFSMFFVYAFVALANIVAAPFNNLLAEKVESYLTGVLPPETTMLEDLKDMPRAVWRQVGIILYFLPRALIFLILFFIPLINFMATPLWFLFSGWFMAMQFIDFPTDNHKIPMADVRVWASQHRYATLGLGVSILFAMMIPGLNLVTMPAAVAAATKFWLAENQA